MTTERKLQKSQKKSKKKAENKKLKMQKRAENGVISKREKE